MSNEVLIFGHKNPDTDTICSAIVKQILNSQQEDKDSCEAMRLGPINKETQFVLDYLEARYYSLETILYLIKNGTIVL